MNSPRYRHTLPQLSDQRMLTDSGLETTLIFHDGLELPYFASFDLLRSRKGRAKLRAYFDRHAELAVARGVGFIADTPTWRASRDWGEKLGYGAEALDSVNREAVAMMFEVREAWERPGSSPVVVSGNIGPRGDGYSADGVMDADEAEAYHTPQVRSLAGAGVDMITVMTMTHVGEAAGIAWAAKRAGVPVSIGFTVETDGTLPTGQPLGEAIEAVDGSGAAPTYYMVNCAHPDHFRDVLAAGWAWRERIWAIRANASRKSHAELDESTELDAGDPAGLAQDYAALLQLLPNLRVFGGCCGTDHRHIAAVADACVTHAAA